MSAFQDQNGELYVENVAVRRIAQDVGTPFYVYSSAMLVKHYQDYANAFADHPTTICYSIKANSNQAVIKTFANLGAGVDVVSEGELHRALAARVPVKKIVFAGVGKTKAEMAAGLKAGILQFNVESEPELHALSEVAASLGQTAEVALRVNPDVDAKTHAKITTGKAENKFGIPITQAREFYAMAQQLPGIEPVSIACHIGSQLIDLQPFEEAFTRLKTLTSELRADGINIRRLDLGGGLGVRYHHEKPPSTTEYANMAKRVLGSLQCDFIIEPGRSLVAEAGILVSKVIYVKNSGGKTFIIADAAMNDLIRPSLYDAWMDVRPVMAPKPGTAMIKADFVGPVCESGDILALNREIPPLAAGDLVAILSAGAYGAVMSSTYNSRLLVPEVLVQNGNFAVVRPRPTYDDLIGLDRLSPWQAPARAKAS